MRKNIMRSRCEQCDKLFKNTKSLRTHREALSHKTTLSADPVKPTVVEELPRHRYS